MSPPYTAVMECEPSAKVEVANVATPAFSVPVPSVVAPSLNVTVPVAVPLPGETAATVAVKVTDWPKTDGLAELVNVVVVFAWLTVCVTAEDVLVPNVFATPPYDAVRLCEPAVNEDTASVAVPLFSVAVPSDVAPSKNVTVPPVGVFGPVTLVTVAVTVVL